MNGDSRGTLGGQGQWDGGSSLQSVSYLREAELQEAANPSSQLQRGRRRPSVPSTVLASHSGQL